jgi:putative ABC transport system substrate-binding protein
MLVFNPTANWVIANRAGGLMKRREFITLIGGAAAWPLAAHAQQPTMPVIGFLNSESFETWREEIAAFQRGLAETGYVEGRNVAIEYRWAESHNDRLPALAAELVRRSVAVIAAPGGTPSALAAKGATQIIPIIFLLGSDPIEFGLVDSLNHPSGNLTGVVGLTVNVTAKRLQLLHELVPAAQLIGYLRNPKNPYSAVETKELQDSAAALRLQLLTLDASSQGGIEAAFAILAEQQAHALLVGTDPLLIGARNQIIAMAARQAIPAIYPFREDARAGGLVSYGPNNAAMFHIAGVYTGRILRGDKVVDLPVQQVTKIEMVINLKTAKALSITFPLSFLGRADEVIE